MDDHIVNAHNAVYSSKMYCASSILKGSFDRGRCPVRGVFLEPGPEAHGLGL